MLRPLGVSQIRSRATPEPTRPLPPEEQQLAVIRRILHRAFERPNAWFERPFDSARQHLRHPELNGVGLPELTALEVLTRFGMIWMNRVLRDGTREQQEELRPLIALARAGLKKLPAVQGPVFRLAQLTPEQHAAYRPGEVVTDPAFVSTSAERDFSWAAQAMNGRLLRSNTWFEIQSLRGRSVRAIYNDPPANEVIFVPGSRFRVIGAWVDAASGMQHVRLAEVG